MKTNKLDLNVDLKVKYELNGADPAALRQRLETALNNMVLHDKRTATKVVVKYKIARAMKARIPAFKATETAASDQT